MKEECMDSKMPADLPEFMGIVAGGTQEGGASEGRGGGGGVDKCVGGRQGLNIESTLKTAMQHTACIGGKEGPIDLQGGNTGVWCAGTGMITSDGRGKSTG
jgi:hypothetical protein